jgi:hypothetical protein
MVLFQTRRGEGQNGALVHIEGVEGSAGYKLFTALSRSVIPGVEAGVERCWSRATQEHRLQQSQTQNPKTQTPESTSFWSGALLERRDEIQAFRVMPSEGALLGAEVVLV